MCACINPRLQKMVFGCTPVEGCIAALDEYKPALEASVLVV